MVNCNDCLGLDRIAAVNISVQAVLEEQQFGCLTVLTDETTGGIGGAQSPVTPTEQLKSYTSIDDVIAEWDTTSAVYKSAREAFSQRARVSLFNVAYVDYTGDIEAQLNEVMNCGDCTGVTAPTLTTANEAVVGMRIARWVESDPKERFVFIAQSNDEDSADNTVRTTLMALMQEAGLKSSKTVYHPLPDERLDAAALSFGLGQDLDETGSAFTMAYQTFVGITPTKISDTKVTNITGFVPGLGCSKTLGNFGSVYTCINNTNVFYLGAMADGNFFDTLLLSKYIKARVQEAVAQRMIRGDIPQNQMGYDMVGSIIATVLKSFQTNGWIDGDNATPGGEGFAIYVPQYDATSQADRKCRIMPDFKFVARLLGRAHAVSIDGELTF